MYDPRSIRFSAHWCADYSKYRGFLAGGISTASSLLPFFGTRLRRQNFYLAPTQYRQLPRLCLGTRLGYSTVDSVYPDAAFKFFCWVTQHLVSSSSSLVPRPVRAVRVTRGGLEPSARRHIRNRRGRLGRRLFIKQY